MKNKIIRELYFGKICPENSKNYDIEAYKGHRDKFLKLYEDMEKCLTEENRVTLEEMIEEHGLAQDEIAIGAFITGFQLGMSLTEEGLRFDSE